MFFNCTILSDEDDGHYNSYFFSCCSGRFSVLFVYYKYDMD